MAAEIRNNDGCCEKYHRMKKVPYVKEGRNTDHRNAKLWGHVAKEKNHN